MARYKIRYFFDWQCTPFWSGNDEAKARFDYWIDPEKLPLSKNTIALAYELQTWHDTALNWDSPSDPGPWRQEECDRFNIAALDLFEAARTELGDDFELLNEHVGPGEDSDLDEYLKDPNTFRRH